MIELSEFIQIKKTVIKALFADEYLMDRLVLKGGTCLELAYKLHHRASKDIDFSIDDDFSDKDIHEIELIIKNKFEQFFTAIGYYPFDIKLKNKPRRLPDNIKMSGYVLYFKLINIDLYFELKGNLYKLRNYALSLGDGDKKDFIIEISKFEYIKDKQIKELDGQSIFVYSPLLQICEKLRAICQKMKEYKNNPDDLDLPRARDFYDIYVINENLVNVDFTQSENRMILQEVFKAKEVDLALLFKVKNKRRIHEDDFKSVLQSDLKTKCYPEIFDYYFEYVLNLINDLQEFRVK